MAKLKRALGLLEITLCGVGIILGAGIYALIGKAAGMAGSAVWISFLIAAIVAGLSGLSYAELSSIFPKAGAEYEYTKNAFGRRIAFLVGWMIIASGLVGASTVAMGFAGYFNALFGTPLLLTAIAIVIFISLVMLYGVKESAWFAMVGTIFEAGGLLIVITTAIPYLGTINYSEIPSWNGVFAAAALVFFAYIGFEEITRMAEELKDPKRNMPLGLIIAIAITTILYILVALSAISVVEPEKLAASNSPLADVVSKSIGGDAFFYFSIIALFATGNTVLLILLATSRIIYGMASAGSFPKFLAYVHPSRQTPWTAIILAGLFTCIFFFAGGIETIANITNFSVFVTFIAINAALIKLRHDKPKMKRPFSVPVNIGWFPVLPALAIITTLFMIGNVGWDAVFYGTVLFAIGLVLYELTNQGHRRI
ncbi:MAG: APC family permease [Candidatus Anstonellales archaeon]